MFADTDTEYYLYLASQYHAWPKAVSSEANITESK